MLFNSIDFAIFLPLVFILYWFVTAKNLKVQNAFIVVASYFFYGWWDWRFLSLILFSTVVDFLIGQKLGTEDKQSRRKALLWISIFVNIGFLGFFKYYNFFLDNFISTFTYFGFNFNASTLNIILPVGISFYTFQTMSYTIDVYKGKLKPTHDFLAFGAFVCFFPQLVAGPIERATNLLPQFLKKRQFNTENAIKGIRLMLWGLTKKIVIADSIAPIVDDIYANYSQYPSHILLLGAFLFSLQLYCDFSGYSMIARGLSKMFGFELMVNFNYPYFSRNIGEFWRKWHISLSTWFRDYVYIPMGGSWGSKWSTMRNVMILFLVSGFWHGANWTFIFWGLLHGLLFIPSLWTNRNKKYSGDIQLNKFYLPSWKEAFFILRTFVLVMILWVFFRAESIGSAFEYLQYMFQFDFRPIHYLNPYDNQPIGIEIIFIIGFLIIEYLLATKSIQFYSQHKISRIIIDSLLLVIITIGTQIGSNLSFIYFQF